MMVANTKDKIVELGLDLIQMKGVNGFSFADIAKAMGIKTASIHYYFPTKSDLVVAVLDQYSNDFFADLGQSDGTALDQKMAHYVSLYRHNLTQGKICLCSDLAMDANNVNDEINQKVGNFFQKNLDWLQQQLLESGRQTKAAGFFSIIQGAQLIARNQKSVTFFDQVTQQGLAELLAAGH